MTARQFELLDKPARRALRVMMHVCDAGDGYQFRCATCGYTSRWMTVDTMTEAKRGLPCPKCNEAEI